MAIRKLQALAIIIWKIHFTVDGSSSSSGSLSAHNWQQSRTDLPLPFSLNRFCVFWIKSNEVVNFPPTQNSNTCHPVPCRSSLPVEFFKSTSQDINNNGEMYDFWWTNKKSLHCNEGSSVFVHQHGGDKSHENLLIGKRKGKELYLSVY